MIAQEYMQVIDNIIKFKIEIREDTLKDGEKIEEMNAEIGLTKLVLTDDCDCGNPTTGTPTICKCGMPFTMKFHICKAWNYQFHIPIYDQRCICPKEDLVVYLKKNDIGIK